MAPVILILVLALAGMGSFVAGIYVLAGLGWALLASSACLYAMIGIVFRGMRGNKS